MLSLPTDKSNNIVSRGDNSDKTNDDFIFQI